MAKFNISKIEIENFRSIQSKATLDIKPGLFAIEGINLDEPASLNGAGKSTLVSALYWCLTGNALTNEVLADDVINSKVGKNCKVVTYIDSEQGEIVITRTRKDSEHGNNLFLEIAGQNLSCHKITDTQQRINQLIKIPFDLLHSTIMMTSDMQSSFSKLTPQQRIQILESIRDYSIWNKIRDEANADTKSYNKQIQELKLQSSNLEGSLSTYQTLLNTTTINLKNLQDSFSVDTIVSKVKTLEESIEDKRKQILDEDAQITKLRAVVLQDVSETQKQLDLIVEESNTHKLDIQKTEFKIKGLEAEINLLDKWFKDDSCPTCNRKLDRTENETVTKTAEKEKLLNEIQVEKVSIVDLEAKIAANRKTWSDLNNVIVNTRSLEKENRQDIIVAEQNKARLLKEINTLEQQVLTQNNEKNTHSQKVEQLQNDIVGYNTAISELTTNKTLKATEIQTLDNKRQISDYFYKLLGAKGELRPYLLNKDIKYLNLCMQKYIARFFKNTNVSLDLNGASIDIIIESSGIRKTVSSLSGGEEKRLNFAIQLALYDLIQSTSQVSFNTLWLDEVESKLDPLGCQQLIEVIEDKSSEIETVFWITNNETVSGSIQDKIICKKTMGKTEVIVQ